MIFFKNLFSDKKKEFEEDNAPLFPYSENDTPFENGNLNTMERIESLNSPEHSQNNETFEPFLRSVEPKICDPVPELERSLSFPILEEDCAAKETSPISKSNKIRKRSSRKDSIAFSKTVSIKMPPSNKKTHSVLSDSDSITIQPQRKKSLNSIINVERLRRLSSYSENLEMFGKEKIMSKIRKIKAFWKNDIKVPPHAFRYFLWETNNSDYICQVNDLGLKSTNQKEKVTHVREELLDQYFETDLQPQDLSHSMQGTSILEEFI